MSEPNSIVSAAERQLLKSVAALAAANASLWITESAGAITSVVQAQRDELWRQVLRNTLWKDQPDNKAETLTKAMLVMVERHQGIVNIPTPRFSARRSETGDVSIRGELSMSEMSVTYHGMYASVLQSPSSASARPLIAETAAVSFPEIEFVFEQAGVTVQNILPQATKQQIKRDNAGEISEILTTHAEARP